MSTASNGNDREQLLRRWAELAPDECEPYDRSFTLSAWHQTVIAIGDDFSAAFLLTALIDAIRARGWHCMLDSGELEGYCYRGQVFRDPVAYADIAGESGNAAEPCDALLRAYLAAIEAQR